MLSRAAPAPTSPTNAQYSRQDYGSYSAARPSLIRSKSFLSRQPRSQDAVDLSYGKGDRPLGKALQEAAKGESPIHFLYLQMDDLEKLPDELSLFTSLTHLDVSFNRLTSLPPHVIIKLPSLQHLNAQSNQLKTLPHEVRSCTKLETLMLFKNRIEEIPHEVFSTLTELRKLDAPVNQLRSLPDTLFTTCQNLKELILRRNRFTSIPAAIEHLKHITRLVFAENQLSSVPAQISNLTNLVELDLSNNSLEVIPFRAFTYMWTLKDLNLGNNRLRELPYMGGLKALQMLCVDKNPLKSLPLVLGKLGDLDDIEVDLDDDSTISSPPLSICRKGTDAIKTYLADLLNGAPDPMRCEASGQGLEAQIQVAPELRFEIKCITKTTMGSKPPAEFIVVTMEELDSDEEGLCSYALELRQSEPGRYVVKYEARRPGRRRISIQVSGVDISGSPYEIRLHHGAAAPGRCICEGQAITQGKVGETMSFRIQARDNLDNPVNVKDLDFRLMLARITTKTSVDSENRFKWGVAEKGGGSYIASYRTNVSGKYRLSVTLNEKDVLGSPFNLDITSGPTSASSSTASLQERNEAEPASRNSFLVQARDSYGNKRTVGGDDIAAVLLGPDGQAVSCDIQDNHDGKYLVSYTIPKAGEWRMQVKLMSQTGKRRHISGSPFLIIVKDSRYPETQAERVENLRLKGELKKLKSQYDDLLQKVSELQLPSAPQAISANGSARALEHVPPGRSRLKEFAKESLADVSVYLELDNEEEYSNQSSDGQNGPLTLFRYDADNEDNVVTSLLDMKTYDNRIALHILASCIIYLHRANDSKAIERVGTKFWNAVRRITLHRWSPQVEGIDDRKQLVNWLSNIICFNNLTNNFRANTPTLTSIVTTLFNDLYKALCVSLQAELSPIILASFFDDSSVTSRTVDPYIQHATIRTFLNPITDLLTLFTASSLPHSLITIFMSDLFAYIDAQLFNAIMLVPGLCKVETTEVIKKNIGVVEVWAVLNEVQGEWFGWTRAVLSVVVLDLPTETRRIHRTGGGGAIHSLAEKIVDLVAGLNVLQVSKLLRICLGDYESTAKDLLDGVISRRGMSDTGLTKQSETDVGSDSQKIYLETKITPLSIPEWKGEVEIRSIPKGLQIPYLERV